MTTALWVLAIALIVGGLVGVIIPLLPGVTMVYLGLLCAAWAEDFTQVGWMPLTFLGVLTLISYGIDFYTTSVGAKKVGASPLAIVGAAVGAVVGIFFSFVGLLIAPFIGAFIGEYISRRDIKQSARAGAGTWLGIVIGIAMKVALVFTMLGIFVLSYIL